VQLDASARRLLAMFVISSVLAVRALPAAAVDDDSADEEHARTYFVTGEYKQALDIYARLYVRTNHPTYLRNIGRCQQKLGQAASVTIGAGPWRFDLTDINGRVISTNPLIENGQVEQSTGVQTPPCQ